MLYIIRIFHLLFKDGFFNYTDTFVSIFKNFLAPKPDNRPIHANPFLVCFHISFSIALNYIHPILRIFPFEQSWFSQIQSFPCQDSLS